MVRVVSPGAEIGVIIAWLIAVLLATMETAVGGRALLPQVVASSA